MGRPKGKAEKPNRYWSKEEKLEIVKEVLNHEKSMLKISKERNINVGTIHNWMKKYQEFGEQGLESKKKMPYNGLHLKKELSNLEKLQLENMKLKVENERLKKGYIVEGDGQNVIYDKSKFPNLK